jgi:hypothetical protein
VDDDAVCVHRDLAGHEEQVANLDAVSIRAIGGMDSFWISHDSLKMMHPTLSFQRLSDADVALRLTPLDRSRIRSSIQVRGRYPTCVRRYSASSFLVSRDRAGQLQALRHHRQLPLID